MEDLKFNALMKNNNLNIELYLLCFNEEKIILHTLNYYSKFCSKIIIIDNESTDNSRNIIADYNHNIEIRTLKTGGQYREDLLMETRNNCWKGSSADFVIVCDMDELIYHENLVLELAKAKEKKIKIPVTIGYNMIGSNFPDNYKIPLTDQVKHGIRDRMFDKNIIFNPKEITEMNYGPGSHTCSPQFKDENIIDELLELKLLHFKYLDKEYLYNKHQLYADRMSQLSRDKKHGFEYLLGNGYIDKFFSLSHYLIKVI